MSKSKSTLFAFQPIALTVMLFLSGLCGISYEILYARMLNNMIGDAFAVNAAILITFLAGIGFGTRHAHRIKRSLWAVESGIGIYAGLFVLLRQHIDDLLFRILPAQSMAMNILVSCILLLIPAFLVGISLPLFAAYLKTHVRDHAFSVSYMVYNFGAALTALLVEFVLIRWFGISDTVLILAGVNICIGISLFLLNPPQNIPAKPLPAITYSPRILSALVLFSMASAIFQLWAIKIAQFTFGPYHETFAMVLALVLGGIAIGALLTKIWHIQFRTFLWLNMLSIIVLLAFFPKMIALYAAGFPVFEGSNILPWKMIILFLIIGGNAISYGAAIPAIMRKEQDVAKESGGLLFVSSLANVAGYLLMVFILHSLLEYGQILFVVLLLAGCALLCVSWRRQTIAGAVGSVVLALVFLGAAWDEDILYLDYTSFTSLEEFQEELHDYERGQRFRKYDETFALNTSSGKEYFFINGYTSIPLNSPPEYIVGAISTLLSPQRDQALVIGLGSGATAGTVAELFRRVDVVEINPIIVEKQPLMKQYSFDIMTKPIVQVAVDDGIRFLKSTESTYDLIVNTVTTPLYFSSSKLYTREFFKDVEAKLSPDGVYTTWLDFRVGEKGLNIILKTMESVFDYCWVSMMKSQYFLFHGSNTPLAIRQQEAVTSHKNLGRFFVEEHGRFPDNFKYAVLNTDPYGYVDTVKSVQINSLDNPVLEFEMARLRHGSLSGFQQYILDDFTVEHMDSVVYTAQPFNILDAAGYHIQVDKSGVFTDFFLDLGADRVSDFHGTFKQYLIRRYAQAADSLDSGSVLYQYAQWLEYFALDDSAVHILEKSVARAPGFAKAHYRLGELYYDRREYGKAQNQFQEVLHLDSQYTGAMYRLGKSLYRLGEYEKAVHWFETCVKRNPYFDNANRYAGQALLFLGKKEQARTHFRRELAFDPNDEAALGHLRDLQARN